MMGIAYKKFEPTLLLPTNGICHEGQKRKDRTERTWPVVFLQYDDHKYDCDSGYSF